MIGIVLLVIVVLVALWAVGVYNRLVGFRNQTQNGWRQIDVQLKRRHDLIPNLVNTVKGAMDFEQGTLTAVMEARAKAMSATGPADAGQKEGELSQALGRLIAVSENYPQLKSNDSFNRLMDELAGTENRIAVERMRYNEVVQAYNTSRRQFPANVTAKLFGFKEYKFFEAPPSAKEAPKVAFPAAKP